MDRIDYKTITLAAVDSNTAFVEAELDVNIKKIESFQIMSTDDLKAWHRASLSLEINNITYVDNQRARLFIGSIQSNPNERFTDFVKNEDGSNPGLDTGNRKVKLTVVDANNSLAAFGGGYSVQLLLKLRK